MDLAELWMKSAAAQRAIRREMIVVEPDAALCPVADCENPADSECICHGIGCNAHMVLLHAYPCGAVHAEHPEWWDEEVQQWKPLSAR